MATNKGFPRAPYNTVPTEGSDPMMIYPPFDNMGFGAPKSAMPKNLNKGPNLEHVGSSTEKGRK